jgi:hypothetical protein
MTSPPSRIGTPRKERITGCSSGQPEKCGSERMSSVRYGSACSSIVPRRPWVRGSSPSASSCAWLMPEVRKDAKPPSPSGTPIAA